MYLNDYFPIRYRYYIFSTGTKMRAHYCETRKDAEGDMYDYCAKHGIIIECTECDKHERKYSDHHGVRFYINRVQSILF